MQRRFEAFGVRKPFQASGIFSGLTRVANFSFQGMVAVKSATHFPVLPSILITPSKSGNEFGFLVVDHF
jgi:hypothetical protein